MQSAKKQKEALLNHLIHLFGADHVEIERNFDWMDPGVNFLSNPDYFKIITSLAGYRNHNGFIKRYSPRCDFYVPSQKLILEYDERQHFTNLRKMALECYPDDVLLSYSKDKWIEHCISIQAVDNDPPYRDEQRAWYDSIRDITAARNGYVLIRIKDGDFDWTSPESKSCLINVLKSGGPDMMPKICRIVTKTDNQQSNTKRLIDMYYAKTLPRATCLVTPGRFLTFNISSYPYIKANDPLCDNPQVIAAICNDAEKEIKAFLNQTQLHSIYEVITIGIDGENLVKTKIELVAIVIKANNSSPDIRWTGKSYPKSDEVHKLIRFRDYQSHCYTHGVERVLVLGCHDLSIYSSRGNKNLGSNSQKSTWNKKYKQVIANFNPTIVLHHPHRTDSTRTWRNAYANLLTTTPTIDSYASAILYQPKTSGGNPSNKIADVLCATAHNNYIDLKL